MADFLIMVAITAAITYLVLLFIFFLSGLLTKPDAPRPFREWPKNG